jgi:hypothetical protein
MSDIHLYIDHHWVSPYAMSAFVALEELKVPYTLKELSLAAGEHRGAQFEALTGRVPALQHGEFWLAESQAIDEYVNDLFGSPALSIYPLDVRERAQLDQRRGHCGTRVTGADDGIRLAILHEFDRTADGAVLLLAHSIKAAVGHIDDLTGRDDLQDRAGDALQLQFLLDHVRLAHQKELGELRQGLQGELDAADGILRREIAAHDIQGDLHSFSCGWVFKVAGASLKA